MTGPSSWIKPERRLALYLRDGFMCLYCGRDLHNCGRAEIGLDHLVPRSSDRDNIDHSDANLITTCRSCNSRRGDRPWRDYAPGGSQDRIEAAIARPINLDSAAALFEGYEPGFETW